MACPPRLLASWPLVYLSHDSRTSDHKQPTRRKLTNKYHLPPGYRVLKFLGTPDPSVKSPYSVQCSLEFDTVENFQKALAAKAEKVLGDVPNFSNKGPELLVGKEVAVK